MEIRACYLITTFLALVLTSGCASRAPAPEPEQTAAYVDPRDPFEGVNRSLWDFNYDVLDTYVLRPATVGYMAVVPKPARKGLVNAVNNLNEPASFLNGALQAKPQSAAISAGRFLVNSTIGLFGLFDVATRIGLVEQNEDFGQTMAVWGINDGAYLMVPARGPTTVRDTTGDIIDGLYFPLSLLNTPASVGRFIIRALDSREQLMSMEQMLEDSLDPYSFVKEAYFQRQQFKIYDGNPPQPEEPDVSEEDYEDFLEDF